MGEKLDVRSMEPAVTTATVRDAEGEVIRTFEVLRTPLRDEYPVEEITQPEMEQ